jgi:hypothetical protein
VIATKAITGDVHTAALSNHNDEAANCLMQLREGPVKNIIENLQGRLTDRAPKNEGPAAGDEVAACERYSTNEARMMKHSWAAVYLDWSAGPLPLFTPSIMYFGAANEDRAVIDARCGG